MRLQAWTTSPDDATLRSVSPAPLSAPTHASLSSLAWPVLIGCCLLTLIGRGLVESFVVFLLPLSEAFGWGRTEVMGIFAVAVLVNGTTGLPVGWLVDRFGQRIVYVVGLTALGGAFFVAPSLTALWQFKLVLGVCVGFGAACLGGVAHTPLLVRLFPGRMGMAMGLIFASVGTGMLLLVPATQWVLERSSDWRDGYHFQAAVAALLVPIVILMPFRRIAIEHPAPTRTATAGGPSFRAALSTRAFWGLTGVYFWTSAAMFAIAPQIVAYLIEIGFEPLFAASAFGIAGFLSAIGIFGAGWLSDRIGQPRVVSISFALSILGLLLLMALGASPNLILLTAFIVVYGLTTGTRGPIVSSMAARLFAGARLGAIYGAMTAGYGIGAALGAFLGGVLFDLTGGYQAVILYAVACLVGGYSAFLLLPREHRRS